MNEILKFSVRNPFTGDSVELEYFVLRRSWECSRCGKGPKCLHADAVIHTFEVEQIVEVAKRKPKPLPTLADEVDRNWEQEKGS